MKNKNLVLILLSFIFLNYIVYEITQNNKNENIKTVLSSTNENLRTHYEIQLHHQKTTADATYQSILRNKKVIALLKEAKNVSLQQRNILRTKLYSMLKEEYKILTLKGVFQFQFDLEDNTVLLRLHKPDKFNDDLSKIRYSYTYVNKEHKIIRGLEKGKTTHAFRNVYPIFDENNTYLCAMEVSYSTDLLQEILNNISKIHTHFIVHKEVINAKVWKRDTLESTYTQSSENENYMMTKLKGDSKKKHISQYTELLKNYQEKISTEMSKSKTFNFYALYNDTAYVVSFYPIKNIKEKKVVAWIVSYEENTYLKETIQRIFYIRLFLFILFAILLYLIYKVINQKNIANGEVALKTKELQEINENLEQKIIIEVEKNKKTQQQLFKSEKMASMGEMIGNIAHQWRQPLSVISTGATGMLVQKEFGNLSDENFKKTCELIDTNAQYLSKTIDDFRNFIKGDHKLVKFKLQDTIDSFLHLVEPSIKNHNINIILNTDDTIELKSYPNELIQCLINIFNNSRDILNEQNIKNKYVFITTYKKDNNVIISIKDNAGGINPDIIEKIFEPYFTTKHKSQGTGLGLHMTYNLIVTSMNGDIETKNVNFSYDNEHFYGAKFIIMLPNIS